MSEHEFTSCPVCGGPLQPGTFEAGDSPQVARLTAERDQLREVLAELVEASGTLLDYKLDRPSNSRGRANYAWNDFTDALDKAQAHLAGTGGTGGTNEGTEIG